MKTHRELANHYRDRYLAATLPGAKAAYRKLQFEQIGLAAEEERAGIGLPPRDDTERAVWKPPCLRSCTVNCGRCALGAGQEERP